MVSLAEFRASVAEFIPAETSIIEVRLYKADECVTMAVSENDDLIASIFALLPMYNEIKLYFSDNTWRLMNIIQQESDEDESYNSNEFLGEKMQEVLPLIEVFIKVDQDTTMVVTLDDSQTTMDLKTQIIMQYEFPPYDTFDHFLLTFEGHILEDEEKLLSRLRHQCTVKMYFKLHGGGKRALSQSIKSGRHQSRDEALTDQTTELDNLLILFKAGDTSPFTELILEKVKDSKDKLKSEGVNIMKFILKQVPKDDLKKMSLTTTTEVSLRILNLCKIIYANEYAKMEAIKKQNEYAERILFLLCAQAMTMSFNKDSGISWKDFAEAVVNEIERERSSDTPSTCTIS